METETPGTEISLYIDTLARILLIRNEHLETR